MRVLLEKNRNGRFVLLLVFLMVNALKVFSQPVSAVDSSMFFNPITDDITKRLPPLQVLIDSATYNSPSMLYEDLKRTYYEYEQLSEERAWLEHFSVNLDMNVGKWNFWDKNEVSNVDKYFRLQSWRDNYAIGFYMRFPLATLVDRRNRIKKQKKWQEISMAQKEINKRFLVKEVITIYNDLQQYQQYIRIYNDYQNFTLLQMQMAQNEFLNGEISTAEYTRLKEIQTRGAINFQQAVAEFNKNYQLLEVTTGMKFNLINILR